MDNIQQICFNAGAPMAATSSTVPPPPPPVQKKRRRRQIADDDDVEVIALSAEEITASYMFFCELCDKGFLREQNLLLHRRAHNLPYVRNTRPVVIRDDDEKRKVYVCPQTDCAHHHRRNALCDLTSLKKHFKRKHVEKTMSCTKCFRMYAVQADLKAHLRVCGTKDYQCSCGSIFSRRDSYVAHRLPCDIAVAQHASFLRNQIQTGQTSVGKLCVPTTNYEDSNHVFSSNTTRSAPSFSFSSDTILAPPVSNLSSTDQSAHLNMTTTDPVIINMSTQGTELNDDIFDVNVLHDRFFGLSGVPVNTFPQPQQQLTLADLETSASFLGSLENSTAPNFDQNVFNVYPNFSSAASGNSYFPVLEGISGTNMNPNESRYHGNNFSGNVLNLQGNYENGTMNENVFGTSLVDKATQNGGQSGFGFDPINPEQLPALLDDFNIWENWGN